MKDRSAPRQRRNKKNMSKFYFDIHVSLALVVFMFHVKFETIVITQTLTKLFFKFISILLVVK